MALDYQSAENMCSNTMSAKLYWVVSGQLASPVGTLHWLMSWHVRWHSCVGQNQ